MVGLPATRFLVIVGALAVTIAACGGGGQPEIVVAAAEGDVARVRSLIAAGVDVNDRGDGEWTPAIHYTQGNEEILGMLLEAGADPNAPDPTSTVLGEYALSGKRDAVVLLLEHGAEIDATNSNGRTALHQAATNGNVEVVELLVERGADSTVRDREGKTAYDLAAEGPENSERLAVMRFLEPDKHPVTVPEPKPGTRILVARYGGVVEHEGRRCVKLTLENASDKTVKEYYGGVMAQRAADEEFLTGYGLSDGIADLQPGANTDASWCPDESFYAEFFSLLDGNPDDVEFLFDADRVVYADGTEDVFERM